MNRAALADQLDRWMTDGYFYFRETGKYESRRPLLKSYLVEVDAPELEAAGSSVETFLTSLKSPADLHVERTEDPVLFSVRIRSGQAAPLFFLDTLDSRYWTFHTIAAAGEADQAIRALVLRTRAMDACWFPSQQLAAWVGEVGTPRSLTAKFAGPTWLYRESLSDDAFLDESLYMRIGSRADARVRWDQMAQHDHVLGPQLALWSARIVRTLEGSSEIQVQTDVTASGKLTSKGTSFRLHQEVISGMRDRYRNLIAGWEDQYRLRWEATDGGKRQVGRVATLPFPTIKTMAELESLVRQMFDCTEPFRLFGIPSRSGDARLVVRGIDLHSGHKVDFELVEDQMRVYLRENACGNVLARLVTNLQHFVDARFQLQ